MTTHELHQPIEMTFTEILRDYCTQIDDFVLICSLILLSVYVIRTKMLDISKLGMLGLIEPSMLDKIYDGVEQFFDTMGLLSCAYLVYIVTAQSGFPLFAKIWIGVLTFLSVLVFIVKKTKFNKLEHKVQ